MAARQILAWRPVDDSNEGEAAATRAERTATLLKVARTVLANPLALSGQSAADLVMSMPVSVPSLATAGPGSSGALPSAGRLLVRAAFNLAVRRALAMRTLTPLEVRKAVVALLLASRALPKEEADISTPVLPAHIVAAAIVVTGLGNVRLVARNQQQQQQSGAAGASTGLPAGLIKALTAALRFVPRRLTFLAEQRRHRKRGLFESKDAQEQQLELVAGLRAHLLDLLQILFEDGVSPASVYAMPMIREIGYKRRDFHISNAAAFVAFSTESALSSSSGAVGGATHTAQSMGAAEANLGVALKLGGRLVSLRGSGSGGGSGGGGIKKSVMKASHVNGEVRSATLEEDSVLQLALCQLFLWHSASHLSAPPGDASNFVPVFTYAPQNKGGEAAAQQAAADDPHHQEQREQQKKFDPATASAKAIACLISLCQRAADIVVAAAALLTLLEIHKAQTRRSGGMSRAQAQQQLESIDACLREMAVRAMGTFELEVVSLAVAAFAFAARASLSSERPLNRLLAHTNNNAAATFTLANFAATTTTTMLPGGRQVAIAGSPKQRRAQMRLLESAAYCSRIRRVALVLCAKMFELLAHYQKVVAGGAGQEQQQLLLAGDVVISQFLEWLAHNGLRLCRSSASASASSGAENAEEHGGDSIAAHALRCALVIVRNECPEQHDAFLQLCCELALRAEM